MTRQTIAGAFARLTAHEQECALRYKSLENTLTTQGDELTAIKAGIRLVIKGVGAIGLSLIVWLAVELYGYVQRDIARNHEAAQAALQRQPQEAGS